MLIYLKTSPPFHLVEDFNVCVVCKEGKTDRLVTDTLAGKLATNLNAFSTEDLLSQEIKDRVLKNGHATLETALKSGIYKIRKKCYDRFNPSKLNRSASAKKRKKKPICQEQPEASVHQQKDSLSHACTVENQLMKTQDTRTEPDHFMQQQAGKQLVIMSTNLRRT